MPQFLSDDLGVDADTLSLVLNGDKVLISESWEHTEGILSQPCSWSIRLGWGDIAAGLLKKYPKRTPFALFVGSTLQATGRTDGHGAEQADGGATEVTIKGRDALAPLQDTYVRAQVSVAVSTYADLVRFALKKVGLGDAPLAVDNAANRKIKTGVPVTSLLPHRTVQQIIDDAGLGPPNAGVVNTTPVAKLNETWHQFLRRYLDRAGLMLWASADGGFVLSAPNGSQPPTYTLVRSADRFLSDKNANVVGCAFSDDATHRHTEAVIYGKGGGKAIGRVKAKGGFKDDEMIAAGYGDQPIVYRDVHVHTIAEASYFARRKLAEERRGGYRLEYRIAGLTLPYAGGSGEQRAVVVPDTVVDVQDEELGISGPYYVETVIRRRSPETTTTVRLMRPEDLVFGGPDGDSPA